MSIKKIRTTTTSAAGLLIVLCIAIAANVILSNFNIRKDLTEEQLYTLSEGTKNILADLEAPVTLKLFFNGSDPAIPLQMKSYADRVEALLAEFEVAGNGKIIIEKYDPKPDSEAEDWAKKYGVFGQSMGYMAPTVYFGLVAAMGESDVILPVIDPRTDNLLEYNVTRMITRVTNPRKPVIGVISSLPVLGAPRQRFQMPGQPPPMPAWVVFQEMQQDYDVRRIEGSTDRIPSDIDSLIVVHPKDLSEDLQYSIDQFVLRGGRLMLFVDPFCKTESDRQQSPQMRFTGNSSNAQKLLSAWGVMFDDKKVVADLEASTKVQSGNAVDENPAWLSFSKSHFNKDAILTAHLETMMMPFAGVFSVTKSDDVEVTPLIRTSEASGMADAVTALYSISAVRKGFKSGLKRLDVALKLNGKFKTAFPEGKPVSEENKQASAVKSLTQSIESTTIFLVGDVDVLFDLYCVRQSDFMGYKMNQPRNDNLAFIANMVEQSVGSSELASVRTRGQSNRPFKRVLELERKARELHLQEETILQTKLEDAQKRLTQIQQQKDKSDQFTMNPQQKEELARFETEVMETRKQLKLVRRRLRADIDKLGMQVKAINILLIPVIVAIIGVCFAYYRKRKTKS